MSITNKQCQVSSDERGNCFNYLFLFSQCKGLFTQSKSGSKNEKDFKKLAKKIKEWMASNKENFRFRLVWTGLKPFIPILPKKLDYFSHSGETTSCSEKMRSVCFLALFLCVTGSPRIQTPQDRYVCHTWNNRESGKDYCCVQSCDINQQQQPSWCYVREIQNHGKYCSPTHTETHKGMFDGYYLLLSCSWLVLNAITVIVN